MYRNRTTSGTLLIQTWLNWKYPGIITLIQLATDVVKFLIYELFLMVPGVHINEVFNLQHYKRPLHMSYH